MKDWSGRTNKQRSREFVLNNLDKKIHSYLGLPGANCTFESLMIAAEHPLDGELALFENNSEVFELASSKLIEIFPQRDLSIIREDVDAWMFSNWEKLPVYDFVWLDYCGPLTTLRLTTIRDVLENIRDDASFALTISVGREKASLLPLLGDGEVISTDFPEYTFKRIFLIQSLMARISRKFDVKILYYRDHVPMLLFFFSPNDNKRNVFHFENYETLEKQSSSSRKSPVSVDGVSYPSIKEAAEALGLQYGALFYRLNSFSPKYKNYKYL